MKPGTIFNAIRKSTGLPVMVRKNGKRVLGRFEVVQLVSIIGEAEWYEATMGGRTYQLYTRFFEFYECT
jgi:hypothetical protein